MDPVISTRTLDALPDLDGFRRQTQALAMLDAIMSPEWEFRYFSFDSRWAPGAMMASMRNGAGDLWFALISAAGVALHGLAHETSSFRYGSPQPWVFGNLPPVFHADFLHEPAFDTDNSTFCIWRLAGDTSWKCGPVPAGVDDGSEERLSILAPDPRLYLTFAREYHERELAIDDVAAVYRHEPLSAALVRRLNPDADVASVEADRDEIGYPGDAAWSG